MLVASLFALDWSRNIIFLSLSDHIIASTASSNCYALRFSSLVRLLIKFTHQSAQQWESQLEEKILSAELSAAPWEA